jgi:hypothetical protein
VSVSSGETLCLHYSLGTVDVAPVTPPFTYNNLCGSVILTSYIPVYIYIYVMSIVINILSTYIFCNYINYSNYPTTIQNELMGVMWPEHDWTTNSDSSATMIKLSPQNLFRKLLKADKIISDILHHICIMIIFGLCCPVLAITISVYVTIKVFILLVVIGRFVTLLNEHINSNKSNSTSLNDKNTLWKAFELSCSDIDMYINNCIWEVVFMSSLFYALLCWDMASDRSYWNKVLWIPITAISLPLAMWLLLKLFRMRYGTSYSVTTGRLENNRNSRTKLGFNRAISDDVELRQSIHGNAAEFPKSIEDIDDAHRPSNEIIISPFIVNSNSSSSI